MSLSERQRSLIVSILLPGAIFLATALLFARSLGNDFLPFDDAIYVTENPQVQRGLTVEGVAWAFTSGQGANWFPLTRISHMVDVEIFGQDPRGHHATSVLLHAINSALVYLLCRRVSANRAAAFAIAFLFAIHPLHVESVSWVSSRKDLLCGLFWFLGLFAYIPYARTPSRRGYALVTLAFLGSFMAKPVAVTFPLVLLLLDYWPLDRVPRDSGSVNRRQRLLLFVEKVPLLLLAAVFSGITILVQRSGGAMEQFGPIPFAARLNNALSVYAGYVARTLWPVGLYIPYPHPGESRPAWHGVAAAGFILAITLALYALRRRRPVLLVGWFWFLLISLPSVGLIQVGFQSMADRYMYLPLLGLLVIAVQICVDLTRAMPRHRAVRATMLGGVAAGLCMLTWAQQAHWRDGFSLFSHAISVRPDNVPARVQLAVVHLMDGEPQAAERHLRVALDRQPESAEAWSNLGSALRMLGRRNEAEAAFRKALGLEPDAYAPALNLAALLGGAGRVDEAIPILEDAVISREETGQGLLLLADFYVMRGRSAEAQAARDRARRLAE